MKNDIFVLCEASKLSMRDEFMRHTPRNEFEENLKKRIRNVIIGNVKDFYVPTMDPSISEEERIFYKEGMKPAVGRRYIWWEENAKYFCPERISRLGTNTEWDAFMAVLITKLINKGWSVEDAWYAISKSSSKFGYRAKPMVSETGSIWRPPMLTNSTKICEFGDLLNTEKFVTKNKNSILFEEPWQERVKYCVAGTCWKNVHTRVMPISNMFGFFEEEDSDSEYIVGWIILEKESN